MMITVDGAAAHAATGGVEPTGDGPVVLMIHGAGMDSTAWQLQTRFLAHRGLRAVAVDLPGHGRSAGEPLTSIVDMADWIERFVEAAGFGPVHAVGHSMGSFIALELSRRHPERVASLALLGVGAAMPVHPELVRTSAEDLTKAAALMAAWSHAKPAHVGLNPTPGMWMLGGARALVENSEPGALSVDFAACADYQEAAAAAAAIGCPVHVIVGKADKMTPPKSTAALTADIPADLLTVTQLADVGHMMMTEDPRSIRRLLLDAVTTA